jgi:hypothetical protein
MTLLTQEKIYQVQGQLMVSPHTSRAELAGLTTLVIIANLFMDFHSTKTSFLASCDNQGMIKKCNHYPSHRLRLHREANSDLLLVQRFYSSKFRQHLSG